MKNLLGAKTHFSLTESILDPEDLVKAAEKQGWEGLVVTDVESIDAMPILAGKAKSLRIGLGVQIAVVKDLTWVAAKRGEPKKKPNPFFVTTLFVRNEDGFRDLCELLTLAGQEDHYSAKPARSQINLEELVEFVSRGNLTMTLGSAYSAFAMRDCESVLDVLCDALDVSQLRSEVIPCSALYYTAHNKRALEVYEARGIEPMLTQPTLYREGEAKHRMVMNLILSHDKMDSIFKREPAEDLHVREAALQGHEVNVIDTNLIEAGVGNANLRAEFLDLALKNTQAYFDEHPYKWAKFAPSLPVMHADPFNEVVRICKEGWRDRLSRETFGYKPDSSVLPEYKERLKYELDTLKNMKFESYFLLVHYIVNWSKSNGIQVGPGRGSVGGSLVGFLMGITDVDPIRFGLIFERFINPDRIDLPDIDLDFMSSRRQDIVDHLVSKFGNDRVSQIANYNTIAGAGAIQAVGKTYGLFEHQYECSKLVPKESGVPVPLEKAVAYVPELEKFALNHPEAWESSVKLQGTFKNFAKHAAGVVVAGEDILKRGVLNTRQGVNIVNWDKRVVEDFGLIKLDVLGLANLDILRLCRDYIKEAHGIEVDYIGLPLDDKKVLDSFAQGKTYGVFQFESGGMKKLLKDLGSDGELTFDDCVAATALFRPGPIQAGLMDMYVAIKKGFQEEEYLHPNMEPALKGTMSVMVYQENVMQISRDLAGYTMAEADGLRKIMGKKDPVKMAEQRDKFVDGCIATSGLDHTTATFIFEQIEKFAGYGFNKSHSVAYTLISYMTMWVKVYYPEAFYAACLSILDEAKLAGLAKDALANDIHIVPPDINHSSHRYEIGFDSARGQKILYAPFQSIKGLSDKSANAIVEARAKLGRGFKSKAELILNIDRRACNKRHQELLDKVGAFSEIEPGQLHARHPDRVRDQKELLPGIVVNNVKASRVIDMTGKSADLIQIVEDYQDNKGCTGCPFMGRPHPQPALGKKPKMMVITDGPTYQEEDKGQMMVGDTARFIKDAMTKAGIKPADVYVTSFIKARKQKEGEIENVTANVCGGYLQREIDLLNPPVIVALGSKAARFLIPDLKGGWEENCGKSHFDPKTDRTVVLGLNPMMIVFEASKQTYLDQVFAQVAEIFDV